MKTRLSLLSLVVGLVAVVGSVGIIRATRSEAATGSISGQAFILNGTILGLLQANLGQVTLPADGSDVDGGATLGVSTGFTSGAASLTASLTSGAGTTHCEGDPGGPGE